MRIKDEVMVEKQKMVIVEAAFQCFVEKGYAVTSINDIIKKYGKSKGSVYYYFKNKNEILSYMLKNKINVHMRELNEMFKEVKDIKIFIEKFLNMFFEFLEEDIDFLKVILEFWAMSMHDDSVNSLLCSHREMFKEILYKYRKCFKSKKQLNNFVSLFLVILAGLRIERILENKSYRNDLKKYIKKFLLNSVKL